MAKFNFIHNKYVLYLFLFLAVTNLLGYLALGDFEALSLFVVVGLVTSYFSKNMIIILGASVLVTALFKGGKHLGLREGFEAERATEKEEAHKERFTTTSKDADEEEEEEEGLESMSPTKIGGASGVDLGKRIDYAGTMEQSYNNLQKILGGGGMDKLTNETQSLIEQQTNLMKQLEGLGPIMKEAKSVMESLENSGMHKMMEKFLPNAQTLLQKK